MDVGLTEGWTRARLGDLLKERRVQARDVHGGDSLPVLSLTKNRGLILQSDRFDHRVARHDVSDYKVLRKGWIAYNPMVLWEGAIHALRQKEAGLVSPVYAIWETREDAADWEFLDYLVRTPALLREYERLASGVVKRRRTVKKTAFVDIEVTLPPLAEQRAIAHVLRTVERAKEQTDQVIAAASELKRSLTEYVLRYGPVAVSAASGVLLADTEVGQTPTSWDVIPVDELAEVKGGKRLPKGHTFSPQPTPYPYVRVVDFENGSVNMSDLRYLTPEDQEILHRYRISADDLYVSIAGTTGDVGCVPPELDGAYLTENAARLVLKSERVLRDYLVVALSSSSGKRQMSEKTTKSTQPKLALARVKTVLVPLPPVGEQRAIAHASHAIESKIGAEKQRQRALNTLITSLLSDLTSGRLRVDHLAGDLVS
jgi:type I restriction enzyme, S subunit